MRRVQPCPTRPTGKRPGLATRLLAAQTLVVLTGSVTLSLVAAVVGPPIFHDHLHRAVGHVSAQTSQHVEEAYTWASAVSIGIGLLAALAAALGASAYTARRVARPITQLAAAAADIAEGNHTVRIAPPRLGRDFDTLAEAFNTMAIRLEAVEATRRRLLSDLGHELRTPVATIEAYLDALEDEVSVDDEDPMAVLRTQTARLRRLIDDLAAVARAEEHHLDLHPIAIAPMALTRQAVAAARPVYQAKGVDLAEECEPELPPVDADPDRMAQILGNLLDNALRHTPPGGQVTVTVGATRSDPAEVRITVADTGEGIPAEHLPHLFERLYRADTARDRDHGGSGIGLAVVRALVDAHGGRIQARSDGPGTGASFTITLPARRSDRSTRLEQQSEPVRMDRRRRDPQQGPQRPNQHHESR